MKYKQVIQVLKKHKFVKEEEDLELTYNYLSYNSKDIKKDTLFICKGLNFKKEYLEEAIKKGATSYVSEIDYHLSIPCILVSNIRKSMAVIAEEFYQNPKPINLIGITGTKGKTTTTNFFNNIVDVACSKKQAYMSSIDSYDGKKYCKSHSTTSESIDIYKALNNAKEKNLDFFTLEVSSQASKLDRIYDLTFDLGMFTSLGTDHISPLEHKDFKEYYNCKLSFLKKCHTVVIYHEIDNYEETIKELKDKEIITYGFSKDANYYINSINHDKEYTNFTIIHNNEEKAYRISMLGDFNVLNATAAIASASFYSISYEDILKGLIITKVVGRMNVFNGKTTIIVDYAHNKLSFEALLKTVKNVYKDKNIKLVFGCPGDRGLNRREEMGTLAGMYASYVYLTAEDPQTKKVKDICDEISTYIKAYKTPYEVVEDREEAIKKAYQESNSDDIVLVLGKGDETYQIIEHKYAPYKSDVVIAMELTNEKAHII